MAEMIERFDEVVAFATGLRRELHANPELTWSEHNTAAKIRSVLERFGIPWEAKATTGTVGYIGRGLPGRHIALRGDIDALAIEERGELEYASRNQGYMHACGHDGHTATLMAAALWLKREEQQLKGPVSLLFQPAEEGGHGAKKMIEEGCLEGVDAVYGWHNWPAIPFGQAVCPDGIIMAGNGTFHIDIHGHGGHSSQPELARDPVLGASAITLALQQIVARKVAPQKVAVVSVTSIEAPSGLTTIPSHARLQGSIRVSDNGMRDFVAGEIKQIAEATAKAYGLEAEVEFRSRYGATINDPKEAHNYREVLRELLGEDWKSDIATPIMASEDFSYYLEQIPGAFALVGSDDGEVKHQKPCHNSCYDFNDRLIPVAAKALMRLAGYEGEF